MIDRRTQRNDSMSESVLDRIDAICESFELRLRAGDSPQIEVYLDQVDTDNRARLREELRKLESFYAGKQIERTSTQIQSADRTTGNDGSSRLHSDDARDPELQGLLHRRLWLLSLIAAAGASLDFVFVTFYGSAIFVGDAFAAYGVLGSAIITGMVLIAGLLTRFRNLSVARLRWIEMAIFGALAAFATWATFVIVAEFLPGMVRADQTVASVTFFAQSNALFWVTLIAAYGLLIPNGWRRNAAVISVLVFLPLLVVIWIGVADPVVTAGDALLMLSRMGVWLVIAASLALYGGHRIESLRRQVHQGQRLGQYRLRQRIGRGGMGEVFLADHALLRRPCAVKVIHPNRAGDSSTLRRFEREVQATAELTSPHTVDVYDFGRTKDGLFYYVMEYLPGVDLDRLVKEHGPLPPARVIHILLQLCSALQEAHDKGLIHRDIKPSNIILCDRGGEQDAIKLLDFGLVRRVDVAGEESARLTQDDIIAGTPAYMSPEQAQGRTDLDARSDIYSLGAVAYFLLTGRPPFVHRSAMRTVAAHIYEPVIPLSRHQASIFRELEEVVVRCLSKIPAKRFYDVDVLQQVLRRCEATASTCERQRLAPANPRQDGVSVAKETREIS